MMEILVVAEAVETEEKMTMGGEKKFGETPGKEADTGERIWGNNPILSTPQLSLSLPQHQYPPLVLHLID